MILDSIFHTVSSLIGGLIAQFLPSINVSLQSFDLSPFASALGMVNQIVPLDVLVLIVGTVLTLYSGAFVWRIAVWVWEHLPVLGHGSL